MSVFGRPSCAPTSLSTGSAVSGLTVTMPTARRRSGKSKDRGENGEKKKGKMRQKAWKREERLRKRGKREKIRRTSGTQEYGGYRLEKKGEKSTSKFR